MTNLSLHLALTAAVGLTAFGWSPVLAEDPGEPSPTSSRADLDLIESIVAELGLFFDPVSVADDVCADVKDDTKCEDTKDPDACWVCKAIRVCCVPTPPPPPPPL